MPSLDRPYGLYAKLAYVQNNIPTLTKSATAKIGAKFEYKYITLDQILEELLPLCDAVGLAVYQRPVNGELETVVVDCENPADQITCKLPLIGATGTMQNYGAAITYARRYSLGCIFQIATEEDDDAGSISRPKSAEKHEYLTKEQFDKITAEVERTHANLNFILARYRLESLDLMSTQLATKLIAQFAKAPNWKKATEEQVKAIKNEATRTGANLEDIAKHYRVKSVDELGSSKADEVIKILEGRPSADEVAQFYANTENLGSDS